MTDPTLPSLSSRAQSLRTAAGRFALPAAPFCALLAFVFFDPINDDAKAAKQVSQAAAHLGSMLPFSALYLLFGTLNIALVVTLASSIRGRGAGWANAGAVLGILGSVAVILGAARRAFLWVLLKSDPGHAAAVLSKLDSSVYAVIVVLILGIPLGYLVLGIAGHRAGLVGRPALALLVLLFLAFFAALNTVAAGLGVLAFAMTTRTVGTAQQPHSFLPRAANATG